MERPQHPDADRHALVLPALSLCIRNELARGETELAGQRLSLAGVKNDSYVTGRINDPIVPWHGSYKTGALMGGSVRCVVSRGAHRRYEAIGYAGPEPGASRSPATKHRGSWREDRNVARRGERT